MILITKNPKRILNGEINEKRWEVQERENNHLEYTTIKRYLTGKDRAERKEESKVDYIIEEDMITIRNNSLPLSPFSPSPCLSFHLANIHLLFASKPSVFTAM